MSVNWTEEQRQVIELRGKNLLVSAAAGSGKTAVLVERIIGRILDQENPADIDRLLVVTFTSAAAAEMRDRIGRAIETELEKNPSDGHLIRQAALVHHAQITTIHSFCLNLLRNYFHLIDLEPNFRIAETGELNLLQEDVMEEVLNRNYEAADEAFLQCVECFSGAKNDDGLKEMIFRLYHFSMSRPWPKEWLLEAAENYNFSDFSELMEKPWMGSLMEYFAYVFENLLMMAKENARLCEEDDGPAYLYETAEKDVSVILKLSEAKDYSSLSELVFAAGFERLKSKRGYQGSEEKLERFKEQREEIKKTVKKLKESFFFAKEEEMLKRLLEMAPAAKEMIRLTGEFTDAYDAKKREKNILDFNDLEHFALKILRDETTKEPTETAVLLRKTYEEVMIDEYQDSNQVQESLMCAVSREEEGICNRFMVGDVKQSIYRFRLASPELFMEKYETYKTAGQEEDGSLFRKIELRKNFRSRKETLAFSNHIFYRIMKKDLGNVEYDDVSALYPGADFEECRGMQPEFLVADSKDEMNADALLTDPVSLEAELVAARIRRMMREQKVTDKKTGRLREVRYSDIVILLRSFTKYADVFQETLEQKKIPVHASSKTGYFQTPEIQTVLSLLRILDNPRQDIPLAAVLRSVLFGFSDEELSILRMAEKKKPFHRCVLEPAWDALSSELGKKLKAFLETLSKFRDLAAELSVHALLFRILEDTGYARLAAAMPGGERRRANIEMLLEKAAAYEKTSYRGLFHFIRYIDKLQKYEVDYGEADVVSENANAVRIMTIHKSKGLEFPVVFLCGTSKTFNRMDARCRMVIHPRFGAAFDYVDPVKRVRGATLYKKAAAKQAELESQGEEIRVLYVALTRAKEKLVITGVCKDIREKIEKLEKRGRRKALSFLQRAGANSFFDWLLPAAIAAGDENLIQVWDIGDLLEEEAESQAEEAEGALELLHHFSCADEEADAYVEEQMSYCYPYMEETNRKTKYSVSELKHRPAEAVFEEQEFSENIFPPEEIIPYVPKFAGGETGENKGAIRGSAMHCALERLPVEILAGSKDLEQELPLWIERLANEGRLDRKTLPFLQEEKLVRFYRSDLAGRMKKAAEQNKLYLERPFVMGKPADEIDGLGSGTMVLIQGIIDVFFIEDGEIVLVDYKTDAVKSEEELKKHYKGQLELYQEAVTKNLGKRVKERLIYSFSLNRTIEV